MLQKQRTSTKIEQQRDLWISNFIYRHGDRKVIYLRRSHLVKYKKQGDNLCKKQICTGDAVLWNDYSNNLLLLKDTTKGLLLCCSGLLKTQILSFAVENKIFPSHLVHKCMYLKKKKKKKIRHILAETKGIIVVLSKSYNVWSDKTANEK